LDFIFRHGEDANGGQLLGYRADLREGAAPDFCLQEGGEHRWIK
jgi:hypothetical protein